ncbi:hypothetical protein BDZ45DRAFT_753557 [Acephala macrosclerotiorum]|nr:hypothetical protein BDZ45DRAFT_753557 [Acephala macrosclerotiorum]
MSFFKGSKRDNKSAEANPRETESIYPSEKYKPQSPPRTPVTVSPDTSRDASNKLEMAVYSNLERASPALNSLSMYWRKTYSGSRTPMPACDPENLPNTAKHGEHGEYSFYKLDGSQLRRCIRRLCEKANWGWFRENLLTLYPPEDSDGHAFLIKS